VGQLSAMKNFKAANQAYTQQEYKTAAELYEQTVQADPNLAPAYFYLGNSYDNQFKPSKKGEAANDEFLNKAIQNYQTAAEKLSTSDKKEDKTLAKLRWKLVESRAVNRRSGEAEPVVQR
jgi:tetratricopeptide (TPR) repeat protein